MLYVTAPLSFDKFLIKIIHYKKDNILNATCIYINQGAKSGGDLESAQGKNQALREAGAVVPTSYEAFEASIKETFDKLVSFYAY
jgi:hypothetical protein